MYNILTFQILASPRAASSKDTGIKKFSVYYKSMWNFLDLAFILVFYSGLVVRSISDSDPHVVDENHMASTLIFIASFAMMCIRILNLFCISELIGPYLVVINGMVGTIMHKFLFVKKTGSELLFMIWSMNCVHGETYCKKRMSLWGGFCSSLQFPCQVYNNRNLDKINKLWRETKYIYNVL